MRMGTRWALAACSLLAALSLWTMAGAVMAADPEDDPLAWLEQVQGDRALAWVRERNAESQRDLEAEPGFGALQQRIRAILDSREQIPHVRRRGGHLYNFWQDAGHPRGLWRRTTLAEYRKAEPAWDVLLDVDALGRDEGVNWVWKGSTCLGPAYRRCLVELSRGGADAVEIREFDLEVRRFVEGGFRLAEAKSDMAWIDADTVFVATDFGPGSMTTSGYPRIVKRWRRAQPLAEAVTVFEGEAGDVGVGVQVDRTPGFERTSFARWLDFYRSRTWLLEGDRLREVPHPPDARVAFWREHVLLQLRSDWAVAAELHVSGSLLAAPARAYLAGERRFTALFTPTASRSLSDWTTTRGTVVMEVLEDVASRLEERRWQDGRWQPPVVGGRLAGTLSVAALHDPLVPDDPLAEQLLITYADFLTPDTLQLARTGSDTRENLKARPSFFDARGMKVEQAFATSADGTRVPYFVVWPRQPRSDGRNPTLLYGYGGFEQSQLPFYSGSVGAAWLESGGVFVLANIRGGGEYGPAWHQAAVKAGRQRSFDDFIAVAADLQRRGITRPEHLGIEGGSNGGLLVGAVMLQRPELFGAVLCQVPLLDMRRYHRLLAGASWMAEYGNPDDPADWAYLSRYSPYQNVTAPMKLPPVFFVTSTRDDRVHPGHARKMAEKMRRQGHRVQYFELIEGGHGAAADNAQRAHRMALEYAFLRRHLMPR